MRTSQSSATSSDPSSTCLKTIITITPESPPITTRRSCGVKPGHSAKEAISKETTSMLDTRAPNPHNLLNANTGDCQLSGQGSQYGQLSPSPSKKPPKPAVRVIAATLTAILSFRLASGASTGTSDLSGHLSPAMNPRNNASQNALDSDIALE